MEYCCVAYDVPLTERSTYNKLRQRIRRVGIPMTMSVYLIPVGLRTTVQTILNEIQTEKPGVISHKIIKFDPSEEKELALIAERGLNQIIKNAHQQMIKRLAKAESEHKETVASIEDALKTKKRMSTDGELNKLREAANDQLEIDMKKALSAADKAMKEATTLSVVFCLTNQVEAAIAELTTLIEHRRQLMKANDVAAKITTNAEVKV